MVVDIGGGTTDVAVAALGGVVASTCLTTAGDQFDAALIQYVRERHQLLIGSRTAEGVKCAIGQVAGEGEATLAVKGRCLNTGLPREVTLSGKETEEALAPVARKIVAAVPGRAGAHPAGAGRRRGRERPAPHRGREPAAGDGHPPGPGDGDGHPPGRGPPSGRWPWGWRPPSPTWPAGRRGSSTWPGGGRWRDRAAAEAPRGGHPRYAVPLGSSQVEPCHVVSRPLSGAGIQAFSRESPERKESQGFALDPDDFKTARWGSLHLLGWWPLERSLSGSCPPDTLR